MLINPLVSVIIPTYNRASYVIQAIGSVLDQTYTNYEIIVIDDGSTDNTKDLLGPYIKRGEIRYIYQDNKKVSVARNTGIKHAKGDLIALLDSDDLWMPDKLASQIPLFIEKNIGLVYGGKVKFNDKDKAVIQKTDFKKLHRGYIFKELFDNCNSFIISSSAVIRKNCLHNIHINGSKDHIYWENPCCDTNEDYHLCLRISYKYKVDYVPKIVTKGRVHEGNSSKDKVKNLLATEATIRDIANTFNVSKANLNRNLSKLYLRIGYQYRKTNKRKAMKYYIKSMYNNLTCEQIKLIIALLIPSWRNHGYV